MNRIIDKNKSKELQKEIKSYYAAERLIQCLGKIENQVPCMILAKSFAMFLLDDNRLALTLQNIHSLACFGLGVYQEEGENKEFLTPIDQEFSGAESRTAELFLIARTVLETNYAFGKACGLIAYAARKLYVLTQSIPNYDLSEFISDDSDFIFMGDQPIEYPFSYME